MNYDKPGSQIRTLRDQDGNQQVSVYIDGEMCSIVLRAGSSALQVALKLMELVSYILTAVNRI